MDEKLGYVNELDPFIQSKIEMELRRPLTENGLRGNLLHNSVLLGMDSKISDLSDSIDVQGVVQEGNKFLNKVSGARKVYEVDKETIECIINSVEYGGHGYSPLGVFYYKNDDGVNIGMDNSTGDAWMEDFKDREECLAWLGGAELEDGKLVEQLNVSDPQLVAIAIGIDDKYYVQTTDLQEDTSLSESIKESIGTFEEAYEIAKLYAEHYGLKIENWTNEAMLSPEVDPKVELYDQIDKVLERYDYGKADGEALAIMLERIQVNWHDLTGVEPENIEKERDNKGNQQNNEYER